MIPGMTSLECVEFLRRVFDGREVGQFSCADLQRMGCIAEGVFYLRQRQVGRIKVVLGSFWRNKKHTYRYRVDVWFAQDA
jgi:hypothetical protein